MAVRTDDDVRCSSLKVMELAPSPDVVQWIAGFRVMKLGSGLEVADGGGRCQASV